MCISAAAKVKAVTHYIQAPRTGYVPGGRLETYDKEAIEMYGIELASLSAHAATWQNMEKIDHTRGMTDTMPGMEDPDKLNRWLGFVQGVLWMLDARTVDQLRTETRECAAGKE